MFQNVLSPIRRYWSCNQSAPTPSPIQHPKAKQPFSAPKVFRVTHASELRQALIRAKRHDMIIICRSGNYGEIHIHNKQNLVICSQHRSIIIQGFITISGTSQHIKLECITLWHLTGDPLHHALISSEQHTQSINIHECILSSLPHSQRVLGTTSGIGKTCQWINGMVLSGTKHQITHNQITHIRHGLIAHVSSCNIQYNTVQLFTHSAISISKSKIWVSNNTIYNPILSRGKPHISYAILLQNTSAQSLNQLAISYNTIKRYHPSPSLTPAQSNHLQGITNHANTPLQNCHVHNNYLTLNPDDAFFFGVTDEVLLDNNTVYQLPSIPSQIPTNTTIMLKP